jgi:glycosyltransferase involved in cell wall biosynthesis
MIDFLFYSMLVLAIFFTFNTAYNYLTAPRVLLEYKAVCQKEKLSILVPARNEDKNIGNCLHSLQHQSYNNLEILVLDDCSTDSTAEIVETFSVLDSRIKLVKGKELPKGWLGKNWACNQLAGNCSGELMVFLDADVILKPNSLNAAYNIFLNKNVELLSVFPSQKITGLGAWLVIPLMNWLLLTFLPLKKVYTSRSKSFAAANGQFIMIKKSAYKIIGKHEAVKDKVVEDMEIARRIKNSSLKMITVLGGNQIYCEMYSSFNDSFNGFSKNFFAGFNTNTVLFLFLLMFFEFLFLFPFVLMFYDLRFALVYFLLLTMRWAISLISNQSAINNIILHPLQILIMYFIGINSMLITILRKAEWKGRRI